MFRHSHILTALAATSLVALAVSTASAANLPARPTSITTTTFGGQTVTKTTYINGNQNTSIFTNSSGKVVGAISSITGLQAVHPGVTGTPPLPGQAANNHPTTPPPPAPPPAAKPQPPAAKPSTTFKPVLHPEITQNGSPVGYYDAKGNIVTGPGGKGLPAGCTTVMAYQSSNGSLSMNFSSGARSVHAAQCV